MADEKKTVKAEKLIAVSDLSGVYNGRPWKIKAGKSVVGEALNWVNVAESLASGVIKKG